MSFTIKDMRNTAGPGSHSYYITFISEMISDEHKNHPQHSEIIDFIVTSTLFSTAALLGMSSHTGSVFILMEN